MKAIFFILVVIFGCNVESTKVRAIRRQWIQYLPPTQNTVVPTQNQYHGWVSQNQRYPIYNNNKLIYSYVDPIGQRYNMFGNNKFGSLDAYKAYLNSQTTNQGQIYPMVPNQAVSNSAAINAAAQSGVNSGYGGIIGQSAHGIAFGTPAEVTAESVAQSGVNFGHRNTDQSIYQSWQTTANGYDGNMYGAPNSAQIQYSADQNVINSRKQGEFSLFVDKIGLNGDHEAQLNYDGTGNNYNNEESGLTSSITDRDITLPKNIKDVYSVDLSNVDIASEAPLQDDAKRIITNYKKNINAVNVSPDNESILTLDQKQNLVKETPDVDNVSVEAKSDMIENGGSLTDVEADNNDTDTDTFISEDDIRSTDDNGGDKSGHNEAPLTGVLGEMNIRNLENSVPFKHGVVNNVLPPLLREIPKIYPYQNNLYWKNKTPVTENGYYSINENPRVHPYIINSNHQQINGYKTLWNQPQHGSYIHPRKIEWIEPKPEIISTKQVNNLVSNICQNPNVNVVPENERLTPAKERIDALLKILHMFGIYHIPRNIYKNTEIPRNIHTKYEVDEKRPIDFEYIDGTIISNYNRYPDYYHMPRKIDLEKNQGYIIQNQYAEPNELNTQHDVLKPHGTPTNDANINSDVESLTPEFKTIESTNNDKQNFVYASENLEPRTENDTTEILEQPNIKMTSSKEYIRQITEAIMPDLVGFYDNQCNSGNYEKLLEGIKALVDSMQSEQCDA